MTTSNRGGYGEVSDLSARVLLRCYLCNGNVERLKAGSAAEAVYEFCGVVGKEM